MFLSCYLLWKYFYLFSIDLVIISFLNPYFYLIKYEYRGFFQKIFHKNLKDAAYDVLNYHLFMLFWNLNIPVSVVSYSTFSIDFQNHSDFNFELGYNFAYPVEQNWIYLFCLEDHCNPKYFLISFLKSVHILSVCFDFFSCEGLYL